MMNIKYMIAVVLMALSAVVLAEKGPTSIGVVQIGMTKTEYINAIGITPVPCKEKDKISMDSLSSDNKSLCHYYDYDTGIAQTIQVGDISYDVVFIYSHAKNKFLESVGSDIQALFFKEKLISLKIEFPKVDVETLVSKYGEPVWIDNRQVQICQNNAGNEFKNKIGNLDAVWTNGNVTAILRTKKYPPRKTCTDDSTWPYYILEEPKQAAIIDDAIQAFWAEIAKQKVSDTLF